LVAEAVIQALHGQAVATAHQEPATPEQESFAATLGRLADRVRTWGQAVVALKPELDDAIDGWAKGRSRRRPDRSEGAVAAALLRRGPGG
jgi:uncharacterized protein HemY